MSMFNRGLQANLINLTPDKLQQNPGSFYITTDEGSIYYNDGTKLLRLGNYYEVATASELNDLVVKEHVLCYAQDTKLLYRHNGTEWVAINDVSANLDGKADKATTLGGYGITDAYTKDEVDDLIDNLEDNDTTYGITYDSVNKKIKLEAGGTNTEIDATDFIKDGMLSDAQYDTTTNKLTLTWNTDAGIEVTEIDLNDLVDTYTGSETIEVSTEGVISVKDGSIGSAKLDTAVNTSLGLADSAVQSVTAGAENGTIDVDGTNIAITGLKSAAYTESSSYETAGAAATAKTEAVSEAKTYADGLMAWNSF